MRKLGSALVVLLLPMVACGGGSSQQSKTDYIAAADALCEQAESDIDALGEPESFEDLAELLPDVRAVYTQLQEDLEGLDEPDEDAAEAQAALGTLDGLLIALDQAIAATEAGDDQGIQDALSQGSDIAEEADRLAREFGFEECGIEPGADGPATSEAPADADSDFPVINDPTEADIAALVPVFNEGAGNRFTDDEAYCMVEYLLQRTTLAQWVDADGEGPPEALLEEATLECLSLARMIEIGVDAG